MHTYNPLQRKKVTGAPVQGKSLQGSHSGFLRDNRAASSSEHAVVQMVRSKSTPHKSLPNKKRTISGHGELLLNDPYTVPEGKEITRPAPPGATLGDLAMTLSENNKLSTEELLKKMVVSTTDDFWYNKDLLRLVLANNNIKKSEIQRRTIANLIEGNFPKNSEESNSLGEMEDQSDFEEWCDSYVRKETFRTFTGGDKIHNMKLTPFTKKEDLKKQKDGYDEDEEYLRSDTPHDENEYVEKETKLSDYVKENDDIHHFIINACSEQRDLHFSGFQIDLKEEN